MNDTSAGHHATHTLRVEDEALVRGLGRFADDADFPGRVFGSFVRSPHAFATIKSIDVAAAKAAPGVLAVLTEADMKAANVGSVVRHPPMVGRGGAKLVMPYRPALAGGKVHHAGQPVALVVATTPAQAQEAAELVAVDYDELTPVTDARAAIAAGAPQLHADTPGNLAIDWPGPVPDEANEREVERIIGSAAHVAKVTLTNQRLVGAPMEPRGATASFDPASGVTTLRACSQSAIVLRDGLIGILNWQKEQLRVVTEDVGGAFGLKSGPYPEYLALIVAAKLVGKPVHWMSTRSEAFLTDNQARDTVTDAELALDDKGKFLALRVRHLANIGAFVATAGVNLNTNNFARCLPAMYRIPRIDVGVRCVFTNTTQIGPYRGAGRPEANYVLERLVDEAARKLGVDPLRLRRKNLIPKSAMPYKTPVGTTYDSGNFPAIVDKAVELADHANFAKRRREAKKRGKLRGLGISCMLEHAGALPTEGAAVLFPGDGKVTVAVGIGSTGQGHATVYARIAAERLGLKPEQVVVRQGDSRYEVASNASVASRGTMTAGSAIVHSVEVMLEKARKLASHVLEASEGDITYGHGVFTVTGTDRRISLIDLAAKAAELAQRKEIAESLDTKVTKDTPQTFPNGCHIAEVEVDPLTGAVEIVHYTAVDDCGVVLDHTIVEGQLHGSLAQGLGQALFENAVYDASGQLMTGSFMDYAIPRADMMPTVTGAEVNDRATTNPLGVKGVGEAGTTGSIAAVMNAIADAVPGAAAAQLDMPANPARVWAVCQAARV
jgi:aerobic carbon-monoxide dehydrogenase large subunit